MKRLNVFLAILTVITLFAACQKESITPTDAVQGVNTVSDRNPCVVAPVWYDGNVECSEVGTYEFTSGRIDDDTRCGGTFGPITWYATSWNDEGECVAITWEWTGEGTPCGVSVIMKGGSAANVYTYDEGCTSGTELVSPVNSSGGPAALSNITFCWNTCVECTYETGWGGNTAGGGKAWWFYFDTQGPATQYIYAGKVATNATVTWNPFTSKFTINLGSWTLQNVPEAVKVQGYNILPKSKPAPGLFTTYKGCDLTFSGNGMRYYAIHLDMQLCE